MLGAGDGSYVALTKVARVDVCLVFSCDLMRAVRLGTCLGLCK